ncbi:unnamed protein product, partial [Rotaria sp. Silwood1]
IARALLRNPKILLLDEATSALDNESEKIVQDALDRAAEGRTTLVIAHRLSTIRNADKIVVIHKGEVVEEGCHEILMRARGIYFGLVEQQNLLKVEEKEQLTTIEKQESIGSIAIHQTKEIQSNFLKKLASTISNSTLHIMHSLNGKGNNSIIVEDANQTEEEEEAENIEIKKKKVKKPTAFLQMLKMNRSEWKLITIGCIACICNGGIRLALAIVLTKLITIFQECDQEIQKKRVQFYVLLFIGFGIIMIMTMFLQYFLFACSGEVLTKRLRSKIFHAILRQEIVYFDDPNNNTGALCTRLATEASAVQSATGIRIGLSLQNFSALGVGIILAFVFSWQFTLLILGFVPLLVVGVLFRSYLITGFASKDKRLFEDVGQVTVESIQNIRTVVQLTKEDHFYEKYCSFLEIPYQSSIKRACVCGLFFALANSVIYFMLAALFRLGGYLLSINTASLEDLLLCLGCILFGAQSIGRTASM